MSRSTRVSLYARRGVFLISFRDALIIPVAVSRRRAAHAPAPWQGCVPPEEDSLYYYVAGVVLARCHEHTRYLRRSFGVRCYIVSCCWFCRESNLFSLELSAAFNPCELGRRD